MIAAPHYRCHFDAKICPDAFRRRNPAVETIAIQAIASEQPVVRRQKELEQPPGQAALQANDIAIEDQSNRNCKWAGEQAIQTRLPGCSTGVT
jgi:hypothetical protein